MARIEELWEEIEKLSTNELIQLFHKLQDRLELLGYLRLCESTIADWDNDEDEVYDRL